MACKAVIFKVVKTKASDPVSMRYGAFFIFISSGKSAVLPLLKKPGFLLKKMGSFKKASG
jgi:hypothetical protein